MSNFKELGSGGEDLAAVFLSGRGYQIIDRNVRSRLGEIDIVASQGRTLCFIEVKTRRSSQYGLPQESISAAKQKKLYQLAQLYLKAKYKSMDIPSRFDVVAIDQSGEAPQIKLIQNAFGI